MRKTKNFEMGDLVEGMITAWEYIGIGSMPVIYEYVLPTDADYKEAQLLWELQPEKWVSVCVKKEDSNLWWDTIKEGTSRWD